MPLSNTLVQLRNASGSTINIGAFSIGPSVTSTIFDSINYTSNAIPNFRQIQLNVAVFNENIQDTNLVFVQDSVDKSIEDAFIIYNEINGLIQREDYLKYNFTVLKSIGQSVLGFSGKLSVPQDITVRKNSESDIGSRSRVNFIEGANITISASDDSINGEIDITINSSGGGGGSQSLGQTLSLGNTTDGYDVIFTGSTRRVITNNQGTLNTAGDSFTIQTGTGNGTGAGGAVAVNGGQGGTTGAGGSLTFTAGAGGSTSGTGGAISVTAGGATAATAAGGALIIASGAGGATSGASGVITVQSGNTVGSASGSVIIKSGTSSGSSTGFVNIQSGNTLGLAIDSNTNFTSATDRQILAKISATSSLQYVSLLSTDITNINNDQVGASYTLVLSDAGKTIRTTNNGGSVTITVPLNSSVSFPIGTQIYITQIGSSTVTISATGGVTLNTLTNKNLVLAERYATILLLKTDTNTWIVDGENTYTAAIGDVTGPGSSTSNAIAKFSGTTGKIIQNSGVTIDSSNNISGINDLSLGGNITVTGTVDGPNPTVRTANQTLSNTRGDSLNLLAGNGNGSGNGGYIFITAGNSGGAGTGGGVEIKSGTGTTDGYISVYSGATLAAYFNTTSNYTAASSRQVLAKGSTALNYINLLSTDITNVNNDQAGTTYTFVLADAGKTVRFTNNSSSVTATVPANSTVSYPVGSIICLIQLGTSSITIAGAGGVTVNVLSGKTLSLIGQYAQCMLVKTGTDTWILTGDNS